MTLKFKLNFFRSILWTAPEDFYDCLELNFWIWNFSYIIWTELRIQNHSWNDSLHCNHEPNTWAVQLLFSYKLYINMYIDRLNYTKFFIFITAVIKCGSICIAHANVRSCWFVFSYIGIKFIYLIIK